MTRPFLLLAALLLPAAAPPADAPSRLLEAYFRAKKPEEKEKARQAIEAAPALDPKQVKDLRDEILKAMAKAGRPVPGKGRNEWFDDATQKQKEKEVGQKGVWKGLFFADDNGKKGLVLGLHGGGLGSGDAGSAQGEFAGAVSALGLGGLYPEVLVKTEYGWTDPPATEQWVMELVKRARVSWGVDPDRVFVTGHSMGGYGTWTYGSIYADAFAAGAAFAGAPTMYWIEKDRKAEAVVEGYLPNLRNLPLFVHQSLDDPRVPAAANVFACGELRKLREKDPEGWELRYEEVNGLGHAFPKKGPKPGLEWATSHARNPRPAKIAWQPTREWKDTFYWVRWEKPWIGATLTASADRGRNAVDLTVENPRSSNPAATAKEREGRVQGISVYLDERLLDPAKEVVITLGGKERFRGRPEPRLTTLLRSCAEREDPGYAFALEARVGPPPPEPAKPGK